jgi:threonylcarbamoyladenosine tRNA methylthiotransferase MtaB
MKVFFHTFGCRANQYDTELVRQAFTDLGAAVVEDPNEADLAVVNSCTVTRTSEAKLRTFVRRVSRAGPETVVMGCAAALDDGTIAALPGVRAVVAGANPTAVLRAAGYSNVRPDPILRRFATNARAWLKIQDGCDEHCTFCATTIARGANRSRPVGELVAEARALADHHAEIVLTGVHIGTYGQDRSADFGALPGDERTLAGVDSVLSGPSARDRPSLGQLLESLIGAVPHARFRLSSIEATEVDDTVARLLIEAPRHLAPHLHAPLQSGSDSVLRRMGRHWYTSRTYRDRLEWLAERLPVFGLGADVIAGFPGETEADHRATTDLVEALPFTYLHVFPFSVRPDAAAARIKDHVSDGIIKKRAAELRELGAKKQREHRARRRGGDGDGVVSGHAGGQLDVLTEDYLSVYLPVERWDGRFRFPVKVE